jgi:hypothetical protein
MPALCQKQPFVSATAISGKNRNQTCRTARCRAKARLNRSQRLAGIDMPLAGLLRQYRPSVGAPAIPRRGFYFRCAPDTAKPPGDEVMPPAALPICAVFLDGSRRVVEPTAKELTIFTAVRSDRRGIVAVRSGSSIFTSSICGFNPSAESFARDCAVGSRRKKAPAGWESPGPVWS